jgi:L-malate glycosyltransferase
LKRLLYFSRDLTPHDQRFLTALAQTDYQVFYLRLENQIPHLNEKDLPEGITQVKWKNKKERYHYLDTFGLVQNLKSIIAEIKPDLIHAGPVQSAAWLAALAGFQPLVSMSWGYDLLYEAETNPLAKSITGFTLKHSAVMVGDCDTVRQKAIDLGMSADRIIIFPWGVDLEHFSPAQSKSIDHKPFVLLSTRAWEPIYGVDVIAQGFAMAAKQQPDLRLIILGSGSQETKIKSYLVQAGVEDQVKFVGQVSLDDLPDYFRDADLYLSASHVDGSSISLLEALACGLPAVVSDIPGNREWITPGENGWLFADGDAQSLADAILHAIEHPRSLTAMGEKTRRVAEERANWKVNFTKLLHAYELALSGGIKPA